MKIAVEGCAHGELEKIYETINYTEQKTGLHVDLLICCGDFQASRNVEDLRCMAVPMKYQRMGSFYKYYSGEKEAPVLTLFIGGNHEASNYLQELAYGGWVAPNIYYMGYGSIVNIAGVRIAGISGIFKGRDFMKGHYEKPPYSEETKRSVYHTRNLEVFRFKQVKQPVDIFVSHDWPRGVYHYGNVNQLLSAKPFFMDEVYSNALGSKPCEDLLHSLKPAFWFAAHLHVKFAALVPHGSNSELHKTTRFLALDKCLPRRKFLQILDIPHDVGKPMDLEYDLEWLTILHLTNHLLSVKKNMQYMPGPGHSGRWNFTPTEEEISLVRRKFNDSFTIPKNFVQTVTPYTKHKGTSGTSTPTQEQKDMRQPSAQINPQTMAFCDRLGIDDPMALLLGIDISSESDSVLTCSPSSLLSPDRSANLTYVSNMSLSETRETSQSDSSCLTAAWSPTAWPLGRPSQMSLSPQSSEDDESVTSTQSGYLSPSVEETENSANRDLELNNVPAPAEATADATDSAGSIEENVNDTPPSLKKFKRRNQQSYASLDED